MDVIFEFVGKVPIDIQYNVQYIYFSSNFGNFLSHCHSENANAMDDIYSLASFGAVFSSS